MSGNQRDWRRTTLLLILSVTALRLLYLFLFCPYDLVEDEATYWEWSRRLDWSYYTKGPGIALAIRAATSLLGESEAAIRSVAAISSGVAALAVGALAAQASRRWHAGFIAASLMLLAPVFQAIGLISTIDGPYVACWAVAAWAGFLALERRATWAWPVLGVALGVGFLFKYTILLLLPGLLFFAIARRTRLGSGRARAAILLGLLLMLAGFAPVIIWNQQNGWPTIAHLLGHLGVAGGDMPPPAAAKSPGSHYDPRWTLEFLIVQIGIVGPALILAIGAAIKAIRTRREEPSHQSWHAHLYLISCALPILLFYFAVSFIAEPEGNWAIGGYVTLLALAGGAVADAIPRFRAKLAAWEALPEPRPRQGLLRKRPEVFEVVLWHWSIAVGIIAALVMVRADLIGRAVPSVSGRLGSVITADVLAADAARRAAQLNTETGLEAFYIAQHYGRASILAYYIPGHPAVRCSSSRMQGRRTQYDYWPDTDLDDPSLLGRPAVLVGAVYEQWTPLFERVIPIGRLEGEHKKEREAFLGYGYKGWKGTQTPDPAKHGG
jgi:4-amino-4-deoxy-L-arabinose transferase-like glycosyltransferase